MKPLRLIIIFTFCILALPCFATQMPSSIMFSPEEQLGKEFMQYVHSHYYIISDPIINDYLNTLGKRLLAHTSLPDNYFQFFTVKDKSINAFSGPAGNIGINSGLINATETESELAGVMAHEIAHSTQKHILRGLQKEKDMIIPKAAALAAAIILGATTQSSSMANAAAGAAMASVAGGYQYELNFTRAFEREADRIGMEILNKSNFDPAAIPNFFSKIAQRNLDFSDAIPESLLSHPITTERISDAKNRLSQLSAQQIRTNDDYYLVKARLKTISTRADYQQINYFKDRINDSNPAKNSAAQYGYAVALMNSFKFTQAESIINDLIKQYPGKSIYQITLGEIKLADNKPLAAVAILKKALAQNPDYYPCIIAYAEALVDAKQYQQAENFLNAQTISYPNDLSIIYLLMKAQAKNGHLAAAYNSRAKIFSIYGDEKAAAVQIEQGKKERDQSLN